MDCLAPYEPINELKPVADDVWIVDGPVIGMFYLGLRVPFTTRMTIVRLADQTLWVHSPTPLDAKLSAAVDSLGPVRFLVAPNKLHYWWIGEWKDRYPDSLICAAPGVATYGRKRIGGIDRELGPEPPPGWAGQIDQVAVIGDFLTEIDFFHRASRTLILTDLIENFEPTHVKCWHWRALMKLGGVADPDGKMPYDLRATFLRHKPGFRAAVEQMLVWNPQRIIFAHGRWYEGDAENELRRAFRWLL
jgi:hypothetical protein